MRLASLLFTIVCCIPAVTHAAAMAENNKQTEPAISKSCIKETQWWLPNERKTTSREAVLKNIVSQRAVLLGEHHNNEQHHQWHLQTIKSLYTIRKDIALGFETFPRRLQPVLDQWAQGKLSETQFKEKLNWDAFWSFDIALYMPLFNYARQNKIPMYALNVDRSLMNNVRKNGWQAIPEQDKEGLSDPAAPSKDYLSILAASYLQHNPVDPGSEIDKKEDGQKFYLFVQGQLLWDRAMAEGVASVARKSDAPLIIGIMGSWHLINRMGVPHQLSSLGIDNTAVLVPWDTHFKCSEITSAFADVIYGTPVN